MPKTKDDFKKIVSQNIQKELKIKNALAVPRLAKIVVNSGIGRVVRDQKTLDDVIESMGLITGQKPIITKAKKAISSFKVRQGMPVGLKVTLRNKRMYDFLERLVNVVFPRMRDFNGISLKSIDESGCLTVGFREVSAFPEVARQQQQKTENNFGLEITFVSQAKNRDESISLYKELGLIFKNDK
jgi:large subunit ribosomal protein L5